MVLSFVIVLFIASYFFMDVLFNDCLRISISFSCWFVLDFMSFSTFSLDKLFSCISCLSFRYFFTWAGLFILSILVKSFSLSFNIFSLYKFRSIALSIKSVSIKTPLSFIFWSSVYSCFSKFVIPYLSSFFLIFLSTITSVLQ